MPSESLRVGTRRFFFLGCSLFGRKPIAHGPRKIALPYLPFGGGPLFGFCECKGAVGHDKPPKAIPEPCFCNGLMKVKGCGPGLPLLVPGGARAEFNYDDIEKFARVRGWSYGTTGAGIIRIRDNGARDGPYSVPQAVGYFREESLDSPIS